MNSIPGWTTKIYEVSNGVFKVTLTDAYGRKAEIIDLATDETIERAMGYAFDIEKQISINWNKFLFDLCLQNLVDTTISTKDYSDKVFGSWFIEVQNKRLTYDGKDSWLIFQKKVHNVWTEIEIINKDKLNYSSFIGQINNLKND